MKGKILAVSIALIMGIFSGGFYAGRVTRGPLFDPSFANMNKISHAESMNFKHCSKSEERIAYALGNEVADAQTKIFKERAELLEKSGVMPAGWVMFDTDCVLTGPAEEPTIRFKTWTDEKFRNFPTSGDVPLYAINVKSYLKNAHGRRIITDYDGYVFSTAVSKKDARVIAEMFFARYLKNAPSRS